MQTINLDTATERDFFAIEDNESFFINQTSRGGKLTVLGRFDDDGMYRVKSAAHEVDGSVVSAEWCDDEYMQYWIDVVFGNEAVESEEDNCEDLLPFNHPDFMDNYKGGRI